MSESAQEARPIIVLVHGTEDGPFKSERWIWRTTGYAPHGARIDDPEFGRKRKWWGRQGIIILTILKVLGFSGMPIPLGLAGVVADGPVKWWELQGKAHTAIVESLREPGGANVECEAYLWSGANLEDERNAAAFGLFRLLLVWARAGRRIHILAHSHGGNVVRRALQVAAHRAPWVLEQVRSVTTIGTPFFWYSPWQAMRQAIIGLIGAAVGAAAGLAYWQWSPMILERRSYELPEALSLTVNALPLFMCAAVFLMGSFAAWHAARGAFDRRDTFFPKALAVDWRSVRLDLDEAILALRGLNSNVRLFRAGGGGGVGLLFDVSAGLLFIAFAIFGSLAFTTNFREVLFLEFDLWSIALRDPAHVMSDEGMQRFAGPHSPIRRLETLPEMLLVMFGAMAATRVFRGVIWLARYGITGAGAPVLNGVATQRLRTLAFGDSGFGIVRVEPYPWRAAEDTQLVLGSDADSKLTDIRGSIESAVSASASGFYRRFRDKIAKSPTQLERRFVESVTAALTWDELAHTAYLKNDLFLEWLLRDRLAATGDFIYEPRGVRPD